MKEVNDRVRKWKERGNTAYKLRSYGKTWLHSFVEGDLVYRNMRKEIFPQWTYDKLKLKKTALCRILKKISDNNYVLEFTEYLGSLSNIQCFIDIQVWIMVNEGGKRYSHLTEENTGSVEGWSRISAQQAWIQ